MFFRERESGVKERPEWKAVLEAARLGQVGAVVFWALDRTGRTRVQIAHDLGQLFRWKAHVASVKDSWLDVGHGPLRDLLVQVMGWIAEGERERMVERTMAGLAAAKARGARFGRPPIELSLSASTILANYRPGDGIAKLAFKLGISTGKAHALVQAEKNLRGMIDSEKPS